MTDFKEARQGRQEKMTVSTRTDQLKQPLDRDNFFKEAPQDPPEKMTAVLHIPTLKQLMVQVVLVRSGEADQDPQEKMTKVLQSTDQRE